MTSQRCLCLETSCAPHPRRAQTQCTNVNVIDGEHHRTTGLPAGQYACWNPITYGWCPELSPRAPSSPTSNSRSSPSNASISPSNDSSGESAALAGGEVAGIAIGCVIAGFLLGFLASRVCASQKVTKGAATTSKETEFVEVDPTAQVNAA